MVKHDIDTCSINEMQVRANFLQTPAANTIYKLLKKYPNFTKFEIYDQRANIDKMVCRDYTVIISEELESNILKQCIKN